MCDPVSAGIAIAAIGTATSVAGTVTKSQADNKAAKANKSQATLANRVTQTDLSTRALEEKLTAQQEIDSAIHQGTSVQGTATAVAAANGVAGNSVDAILADIGRQESVVGAGVKDQLAAQLLQIERERAGSNAGMQSRIAAVQPANPWATGLTIAGQVTQGASAYIAQRKPRGS